MLVCLFIAGAAFLRIQTEDEIYYGVNELDGIPRDADTSLGVITIHDESGYEGVYAQMPVFSLQKGSYRLRVEHQDEADSQICVMNGGRVEQSFVLSGQELVSDFSFTLAEPSDHIQILFQKGAGTITLKNAVLYAQNWFYADTVFCAALLLLFLFFSAWLLRRYGFRDWKEERKLALLITVGLAIFVCYPLYNDFLNFGHDLNFHLMRIEGISSGLREGQFPVRVYPDNLKGHGYLASLYPDFFLYIPAVLRLLGVSAVTSYKFLVLLIQLATMGLSWYGIRRITGSEKMAFMGMVLYTLAPYRLVNLYMRAAIGEALAMVFLPLVLAGLYEMIAGDRRKWYLLVLGLTGIMESHVLSCLFIAAVCIVPVLGFAGTIFREKRVACFGKAFVTTVLLNLGFLVPFLYYSGEDLKLHALNMFGFGEMALFPSQFFMQSVTMKDTEVVRSGIGQEMLPMLGLTFMLGILLTVSWLLLQKEKEKRHQFLVWLFLVQLLFLYGSSTWCPWETLQKIGLIESLLVKIQFPWRFLGIVSVLGSVLIPVVLDQTPVVKKYAGALFVLLAAFCMWESMQVMDATLTQDIRYTKLTGDIADATQGEYAPARLDIDSLTFSADPVVLSGEAKELQFGKKGTSARIIVSGGTDEISIELPIAYYKGYVAMADGVQLPLQESEGGKLALSVPAEYMDTDIMVSYRQPALFYEAFLLSAAGAVLLGVFVMRDGHKWKNKVQKEA